MKSPEEIIEDAVDETSAVFEGFVMGRLGVAEKTHPEIKDEFRLIIRTAFAAYDQKLENFNSKE